MDSCDVLIVGGGPAGSSCAWKLRHSGLSVTILDRRAFPRDKICGGWITPAVFDELAIDPAEYGRGRVLQPITGFRTSYLGGRELETDYGRPVSYGIRRFEFDDYLLRRCGARIVESTDVRAAERSGAGWIVNGRFRSLMLVGAGGTFCPVARFLGARVSRETAVAAQEAEFQMDEIQGSTCSVRGEVPELYFFPDMKGYGWCFRKQNVLNVGLGRLDQHALSTHVAQFVKFLATTGRLPPDTNPAPRGHAYLLYGNSKRNVIEDGVLLIGDSAGLAYTMSGEGIRPAIESGLLAAEVIAAAKGCYSRERLEPYGAMLLERFGKRDEGLTHYLPEKFTSLMARRLLSTSWFTRQVLLDRWFLRDRAARTGACRAETHLAACP